MMTTDPEEILSTASESVETRFKRTVEASPDLAMFLLGLDGNASRWVQEAECFEGQRLGKPSELVWRVRKDGSRFWALVLVDAIHDGSGTT